jgi:putative membrane-bound dehydrogenase-like protein
MQRRASSRLILLFTLILIAGVPQLAFQQAPARAPATGPVEVPLHLFQLPDEFEVTLWAASPLLRNPTNIDIDRDGRIWVAEGVRYRSHFDRQPEGDRIVVIQDTNGDGKADSSHTFVQEPGLIAPLGVSVIDNKIVVAQPPDLIVYTDVDRNLRFDPAVDRREVLLTGFQGINHDHSLHSVTVGPDGKWVFNAGNMGATFTDRSGKTFRIFSAYRPGPVGPFPYPHDAAAYAGKPSDDGHVYVGGFTARMNPDGTNVEIIGHNYRNSYEQSVTSLGDVFQNDNDDPPACRVSWVMEYANFGFSSNDGQRTWQADRRPGQTVPVAEWRQDDPGIMPAGDIYGGGSPTGNVFYENGALGPAWEGTFFAADAGRNEIFSYQPVPDGAGFALDRSVFITSNAQQAYAGSDFVGGNATAHGAVETLFRPSDIAIGPDGALYVSDWIDARVGGHRDLDDTLSGAIYRIAPKGFVPRVPTFDASTIDGLITALRSPAPNVRAIGFEGLKARGASAVNAVAALLNDPNPYIRGRAMFLLYQLGPDGRRRAGSPESHADPAMRIAAFRAMRRAGLDVMSVAAARPPWRCATVPLPPHSTSSWTSPAASTAWIASISKRSGPAPPARRRRSTTGSVASCARRRIPSPGRAPSRGSPGGCTCQRQFRISRHARGLPRCRSPTAGRRWTRSRSSLTRRPPTPWSSWRAPTVRYGSTRRSGSSTACRTTGRRTASDRP